MKRTYLSFICCLFISTDLLAQQSYIDLPGRHHSAGVYNPSTESIFIFGGTSEDNFTGLNDTWSFSIDNGWKQLSNIGPPPRASHMLFYNPIDNSIHLYGGWDDNKQLSDHWIWESNRWSKITGTAAPGARSSAGVVYDATMKAHILYGGCADGPTFLSDTWQLKDGTWTKLIEESKPGQSCRSKIVFDPASKKPLMFGGSNSSPISWQFNDSEWSNISDEGPTPRYNHMMVADTKRNKVVLFGGAAQGGVRFDDTWEWDGKRWLEIRTVNGPSKRDMSVMVYDPKSEKTILYGGRDTEGNPIQDLWTWDGKQWEQIY